MKKLLVALVLGIFLIGLVFAANETQGNSTDNDLNETEDNECIDSDGGLNYHVRGSLSGICAKGELCGAWIDQCSNSSTLLEYTCDNLNG